MADTLCKEEKLIRKAFDFNSQSLQKWQKYECYANSKYTKAQWNKKSKFKRSKLFVPITQNVISIVESIFSSSFFSAGCPIEILPVGDSDKEAIAKVNVVIKDYWDRSSPYGELAKVFRSSLIFPLACCQSYWECDTVRVDNIPLTDFATDPEALNHQGVEYVAHQYKESANVIQSNIDNKVYLSPEDKSKLWGNKDFEDVKYDRFDIKEIFERCFEKGKEVWRVTTICNGVKLRDKEELKDGLPFSYGYAINQLPSVDTSVRAQQNLSHGLSFIETFKNLQDEVNIKRNQKNDIIENKVVPKYFIASTAGVNPAMLDGETNKHTKCDNISGIFAKTQPAEYDLTADLGMLNKDIEDATGVNGILKGSTSASDRRSSIALSTVNANSSMRVEQMIMLVCDTLFKPFAKRFVRLVLKNHDETRARKLLELESGAPNPLKNIEDYDVKINFGSTVNQNAKIQDLMTVFQMLSQNQNIDPDFLMDLLKEILTILLGENTNLNKLFSPNGEQAGNNMPPPTVEDLAAIEAQQKALEELKKEGGLA